MIEDWKFLGIFYLMKLKIGIISLCLNFLFLYIVSLLWDIQKNIEVDAKEALNIEEIKGVKRRNN